MSIAPTKPDDPFFPFPREREAQSVDVTTSGARVSSYKVQFVPPGLVRYVMPKVRPPPSAQQPGSGFACLAVTLVYTPLDGVRDKGPCCKHSRANLEVL